MEFNVVVKLKEEELKRLSEALNIVNSLSEKTELEKSLSELREQEQKLTADVLDLRDEKKSLQRSKARLEKQISNLRTKGVRGVSHEE